MKASPGEPAAKVQCPRCQSRLDVFETQSGGRLASVTTLGPAVEQSAQALERFNGPDKGPEIQCPACGHMFDPSGPYRGIPPLRRDNSRA